MLLELLWNALEPLGSRTHEDAAVLRPARLDRMTANSKLTAGIVTAGIGRLLAVLTLLMLVVVRVLVLVVGRNPAGRNPAGL